MLKTWVCSGCGQHRLAVDAESSACRCDDVPDQQLRRELVEAAGHRG